MPRLPGTHGHASIPWPWHGCYRQLYAVQTVLDGVRRTCQDHQGPRYPRMKNPERLGVVIRSFEAVSKPAATSLEYRVQANAVQSLPLNPRKHPGSQ